MALCLWTHKRGNNASWLGELEVQRSFSPTSNITNQIKVAWKSLGDQHENGSQIIKTQMKITSNFYPNPAGKSPGENLHGMKEGWLLYYSKNLLRIVFWAIAKQGCAWGKVMGPEKAWTRAMPGLAFPQVTPLLVSAQKVIKIAQDTVLGKQPI